MSGGTETDIGTGESYTVVDADVGSTLKVEASFTDDDGTAETIESAETSTVEALPALPALSIADASVDEGDAGGTATLVFTVTLNNAATETVTVDWATSDGTATAGTDYTAGTGSLTFNSGDSSKTVSVTVAGDNVDEPNETLTVTLSGETGATIEDGAATGTITDDDATPTVTLVLTPDTITEAAGASTVTASLDHPSNEETTVTVSVTPQSPATASDYALSSNLELRIAAGDTTSTGTVTITAANNADYEGDKTVTVSATATNGLGVSGPDDVELTIEEDEAAPLPSITVASDGDVTEGSPALFTLTRTGDPAQTLDVIYEVTASGNFGVTTGAATATFPASNATVQVSVATTDDSTHEAHGSVTVTLQAGASYELGTDAAATVAVRDDDNAVPTVSVAPVSSSVEEGEDAQFTVTRTVVTTGALTVRYSVSESGAMVASDDEDAQTVDFGDGESEKTVTVPTVEDSAHEADSTVTVTLTPDASYALGTDAMAEVTVEDDDNAAPTGAPTIDDTRPVVGETLNADPSGIDDADGLTSATYAWRWIRVASGGGETEVGTGTSYTVVAADVGSTLKVEAGFTDDDGTPETRTSAETSTVVATAPTEVSVMHGGSPITEGGVATFTFTLSKTIGDLSLRVNIRRTETGNMMSPSDLGRSVVVFGPNQTTLTVSYPTVADDTTEPNSTVTVEVLERNFYVPGTPSMASVEVRDDDDSPATGSVTVTGTATEGETLTADTSGLTDGDGLDNAAWVYQWVRTPSGGSDADISGATGADLCAGVRGRGRDAQGQGDGHRRRWPRGGASRARRPRRWRRLPRPTVTVASDGDVTEGSPALFTVRRTGDPAQTLNVDYEVTATGDFGVTPFEATLAFLAGNSTVQLNVSTTGDGSHEAHGSVTLTLTADTGTDPAYLLGAPSTATAAVEDDDDSPATGSVTVTGTAAEGETLTANTSGLADADGLDDAAYTWQWVRTPSGGSDADISGATGATYVPVFADAGATLKVKVTVTDDEGHEAEFTSAPTSAVAATPRPEVTVASDGDVTEGETVTFTLTRTGDTAQTLDVAYGVTATGNFGAATGAGTATFPANNATVQVSVATTGDSTHEAHGSVTVTLTADTGDDPAYLLGAPSTATAAVKDDDDSPATGAVTVTGTATEGETLTADTSGLADADGLDDATYTWQWVGTPSGGGDADISGATSRTYVPVFADAGATLKVRVTVTDDEGHEATFTSAPTSAVTAASRPSVTVASDGDVTEGSAAAFTLTRTGDTAQTLDVAYDVTASGNFGVTTGAGTATFPANSATVQVSVATTGDSAHEAHGSVTVTLTAHTSADPAYVLGAPSTATAAVDDDDDSPTTGTVTVTGTATEGETLTADTSGLTDGDGLDNAAWVYQWVRTRSGGGDEDISGATSRTYVPVFADAGATLKVKVTVTDDDGHEAEFTSAPTSAVTAASRPSVTVVSDGDVTEGDTVTFTVRRTGDPAQTLNVDYEVAAAGDFGAATGAGTATFLANNTTVQVSVATTDDGAHEADGSVTVTLTADTGDDPAWLLGDPSTAMAAVEDDDNAAPTGSVTIDGTTPVVGETLNADASGIDDPDGLTSPTYAWQWIRVASGGTETRIVGATSASYTVAAADVGATLKVEARFTDDDGTAETVESAETAAVTTPGLSIGDARVNEGDSGDSATLQFTVTLNPASSGTVTVDWSTADGTATAGRDYTAGNGRLTFSAGDTVETLTVSVTGDDIDEPNETFAVTLSNASGAAIGDGTATGTIADDDPTPVVTLVLTPSSISEVNEVSAVTARLDRPSSAATTVTVSVAPVSPTVAGDYTLSGTVLTIAAGATTSTGAVTITAVNNAVDAPDREATVSATATNSQGVTAPAPVTLTLRDNDAPPTVTLHLSADSISEAGGTSTVTASLNHPSGEDTTVAVSVAPVSPAVAGDYTLSGSGLTIPAGSTTSTGAVTITGVDNAVDAPDKAVTVSATATNPHSGTSVDNMTLTIADDDDAPVVTLVLTPSSIGEDGGTSTVTARLDRPSSAATTVTVSVAPVSPTVAGDYRLGSNRVLTIAAGATTSAGTVTVTAVNDDVDAPDKAVTVSATAANSQGVTNPPDAALTITDDDAEPRVTLHLDPPSISEVNGTSAVTATLDRPSSATTTVTVSPSAAGDYRLGSNRVLTIAAGATTSTGDVTVTAVNNAVDAPDKETTVSATATNSQGVTAPAPVTLTLRDNDATPTVTLRLSADSISEAGGTSTVTASLNHPSSEDTTVTVSVAPVLPAVAGDFTLGGTVLTIAAGTTTSTGAVTITGVDNAMDAPDKTVTVSGAATNAQGVTGPQDVTLTIVDDDNPPTVTVAAERATVTEGEDAVFVLTRSGDVSSELAVSFTVTGGGTTLTGDARPTGLTFQGPTRSRRA